MNWTEVQVYLKNSDILKRLSLNSSVFNLAINKLIEDSSTIGILSIIGTLCNEIEEQQKLLIEYEMRTVRPIFLKGTLDNTGKDGEDNA